jgi:hypothetical protein
VSEDISGQQVADVVSKLRELAALEDLVAASIDRLHGVTESVCELVTRNIGEDDAHPVSATPPQRGHWMIYVRSHQWLEFRVEPGTVVATKDVIAHCTVRLDEQKVAGAALVKQDQQAEWLDDTTHEPVGRAWVLALIHHAAREKLRAFSKPAAAR